MNRWNQLKKWGSFLLVLTVLTNCVTGCNLGKENKYQIQYLDYFDTVTQITKYANSEKEFDQFQQFIANNLEKYHKQYDIYHTYDGINNIRTINENAGIAPVKVDREIIEMLLFAKEAYTITDGKVNVALGSVLKIWHDYRTLGLEEPHKASVPTIEELEEAFKHTDIKKILIDQTASTVYLNDKGMSLDVGAVAKGYATEQVCLLAIEQGYDSGLVSVGGNIRAIGVKDSQQNTWNVGIQNPDIEADNSNLYVLELKDLSLVTSGTYQRYYTVDGKQYHHIIDPVTLMPAAYFTSVSIICKDSGMADVLSTALFNMSYEQGKKLIESIDGTQAVWVFNNQEVKYTDGFNQMIHQ